MQTEETAEKKEEGRISKIENGTVIDHISSGSALKVLEILGILSNTNAKVSFVMNISSLKAKNGKKDIVKFEGRELTKRETDKITVVSPGTTINIIRNYEIAKKYHVELPDKIIDIIKCPNPNCATNNPKEMGNIITAFKVIKEKTIAFECHYCGIQINNNILEHIKY